MVRQLGGIDHGKPVRQPGAGITFAEGLDANHRQADDFVALDAHLISGAEQHPGLAAAALLLEGPADQLHVLARIAETRPSPGSTNSLPSPHFSLGSWTAPPLRSRPGADVLGFPGMHTNFSISTLGSWTAPPLRSRPGACPHRALRARPARVARPRARSARCGPQPQAPLRFSVHLSGRPWLVLNNGPLALNSFRFPLHYCW